MLKKSIVLVSAAAFICSTALAGDKDKDKPDFAAIDKDSDGSVSMAELKAVKPDLTEEKFKMKDKDGDGKLSKEEFGQHGKKDKAEGEH